MRNAGRVREDDAVGRLDVPVQEAQLVDALYGGQELEACKRKQHMGLCQLFAARLKDTITMLEVLCGSCYAK